MPVVASVSLPKRQPPENARFPEAASFRSRPSRLPSFPTGRVSETASRRLPRSGERTEANGMPLPSVERSAARGPIFLPISPAPCKIPPSPPLRPCLPNPPTRMFPVRGHPSSGSRTLRTPSSRNSAISNTPTVLTSATAPRWKPTSQFRINTDYSHHRYDVLILINGVPVVQCRWRGGVGRRFGRFPRSFDLPISRGSVCQPTVRWP